MNMSARMLASVIRHSIGWNGQKIRLLSCSTGKQTGDNYCFAEELANALGVEVKAPNDLLYIYPSGRLKVGALGEGHMLSFLPNQRKRKKMIWNLVFFKGYLIQEAMRTSQIIKNLIILFLKKT